MAEQICPRCQAANPSESYYCGRCGTALSSQSLVPSPRSGLTVTQPRWPALPLTPAARAAALSLGAVALKLALGWLRGRARRRRSLIPSAQPDASLSGPATQPGIRETPPSPAQQEVIISRRWEVAVWERGSHVRQVIESLAWRRDG